MMGYHHPPRPAPQEQTPLGPGTPSEQTPPCAVHAGRYSQQAGGMHPTGMQSCYHPQQSWGKVMFSQLCVILFTGGSVSVHAGIPPPPGADTHPRADTPGADTPSGADTLRADTPPGAYTPRRRACWEIRSTRGRYASYWNAILFENKLVQQRNALVTDERASIKIFIEHC